LAPGACDEVLINSSAANIPALLVRTEFHAVAPLQSGLNSLQALCLSNREPVADSQPLTLNVRLPDIPKAWIRTRTEGTRITLDAGRSERARGLAAPLTRFEWRARSGNPGPLALAAKQPLGERTPVAGERIELTVPERDGDYYVTLRAIDAKGRADESTTVFRVAGQRASNVDIEREPPRWSDSAVIYSAVPALFGKKGYASVSGRLKQIAGLGADTLLLSPVSANVKGDFGYAVVDHFQVRKDLGTEAEFRALVQNAHSRGLKVLLDFVPNHLAGAHPYAADARTRGTSSPYYDWFERQANGEPVHALGLATLDVLNYDNPEVQNYLIAALGYWVQTYDVDGFRFTSANAVGSRAPEFFRRAREELTRIKPDLLLMGASSPGETQMFTAGFDAALDRKVAEGEAALGDAFGASNRGDDVERLRTMLSTDFNGVPRVARLVRFLNDDDTGARFATRHGAARAKAAAALLLTLPGLPLIYNGDEVGAEFDPMTANKPIDWRDRNGLTPLYTKLIKLRRTTPALRSPALQLVTTDQPLDVLAYLRGTVQPVLVLINVSTDVMETKLESSPVITELTACGMLEDLLSGESLRIDPAAPMIKMTAYGTRVLRPDAKKCPR
jgi:glycosidase